MRYRSRYNYCTQNIDYGSAKNNGVALEGGFLRVGVTDAVQRTVNPVEFIRMLPKGRFVARGHPFGSIEKGRKIVLLRVPVSGITIEVNEKVREDPIIINRDPYGEGWLIAIEPLGYEGESKCLLTEPPKL